MFSQVLLSDLFFLIFLRGKMRDQLYLYVFIRPISFVGFTIGGWSRGLAKLFCPNPTVRCNLYIYMYILSSSRSLCLASLNSGEVYFMYFIYSIAV